MCDSKKGVRGKVRGGVRYSNKVRYRVSSRCFSIRVNGLGLTANLDSSRPFKGGESLFRTGKDFNGVRVMSLIKRRKSREGNQAGKAGRLRNRPLRPYKIGDKRKFPMR